MSYKQNQVKNNSKLIIKIDNNAANNGTQQAYRDIISPLSSHLGYLQTQSSKASTTRNNRSRKLAFSKAANNNSVNMNYSNNNNHHLNNSNNGSNSKYAGNKIETR